MTAADAAALLAAYGRRSTRSARPPPAAASIDGPGHLDQALRAASALQRAQRERVMARAATRACWRLARSRKRYDIGLNIDAEEADRLELSLDLLERCALEPALRRLERPRLRGAGLPEARARRDRLAHRPRAAARGRRLMVRLVKGAYWDCGDQARAGRRAGRLPGLHAQARTPTSPTSPARASCSRRRDAVYPQFATHNAQTLAAIYGMAGAGVRHRPVRVPVPARHGRAALRAGRRRSDGKLGRPCRIYAPVGTHETLLAYLVRRLLENGANTSFVNRIADPTVPIDELVADPVASRAIARRRAARRAASARSRCRASCTARRGANSRGLDLADEALLAGSRPRSTRARGATGARLPTSPARAERAASRCATRPTAATSSARVREATPADVDAALARPQRRRAGWAARRRRSARACLERAADALEARDAAR